MSYDGEQLIGHWFPVNQAKRVIIAILAGEDPGHRPSGDGGRQHSRAERLPAYCILNRGPQTRAAANI